MLKVRGLFYKYGDIGALKDVDLDLNQGEILGVVGPNGAGKTTLLKCIAGIKRPQRADIAINGVDTSRMKRLDLAKLIGYVPQSAPSKFPITVFESILMGRRPYIAWRPSRKDLDIVADILGSMNLGDVALRDFDQLSGGQKQRVLIARAFAQEPGCLLFDEPTSSLDLRHQLEVMTMISGMVREKSIGAILAMHDLNLTARFCDRVVMLKAGRVFCTGEPAEIMTIDNIRKVYDVEAVISQDGGRPYIMPVRPAVQADDPEKQGVPLD